MRTIILITSCLLLAACSDSRKEVLKSPCVGAEGSPCGPLRPVNDWWMQQKDLA